MEQRKIIGFRSVNFKTQDGVQIDGVNLFVTYVDERVKGTACEKIFVSLNKLGSFSPSLGDDVSIIYNRFGKVDGVQPIKK